MGGVFEILHRLHLRLGGKAIPGCGGQPHQKQLGKGQIPFVDPSRHQRIQVKHPQLDVIYPLFPQGIQIVDTPGLQTHGIVQLRRKPQKTLIHITLNAVRIAAYAEQYPDECCKSDTGPETG